MEQTIPVNLVKTKMYFLTLMEISKSSSLTSEINMMTSVALKTVYTECLETLSLYAPLGFMIKYVSIKIHSMAQNTESFALNIQQ